MITHILDRRTDIKGSSHIQNGARPTSLRAKKRIFARMTAGVCSITAASAAIFRDRPAFAGHRNLFLIQGFSNGWISDLRNMTCTNFRCAIYARSGRRRTPGRTSGGARPSVARVSGGRQLPTETRKAPALISTGLRTTPVSLLTGAGRFLITSFRRAPPEPRPKCDRVHFKQKIRSTPWRIWNSATFGRSTISAGDRWIKLWRRQATLRHGNIGARRRWVYSRRWPCQPLSCIMELNEYLDDAAET